MDPEGPASLHAGGVRRCHARPFDTSIKSHFWKISLLLAINAHEMAPRTNQWLRERTWDTPTKGLVWIVERLLREDLQDLQDPLILKITDHWVESERCLLTVDNLDLAWLDAT